ncbi:hypothetical protein GCM10027037_05700 [Mucilaginibacter koreensis]
MSGFIGLISPNLQTSSSALLDNCQQEIASCCNDYLGNWKSANADMRFGWLRVADDTESEQQPFTVNQQIYITGDVRLDNRERLIGQLCQHFNAIDTCTPDTYIVLYAYMHWGEKMMQYLSGDFAFAIWDEQTETLFCARDHFGIIPLYYAQNEHGFFFTNYYRALKHVPGLMQDLQHQVLLDYFFAGRNQSFEHTVYKDIYKLPPAHQLVYKHHGKFTISPYWQLPQSTAPLPDTTAEVYAHKFQELFKQSVTDRIRNRRISCHLSGGMDSSSITAVSKKVMADSYGDNFQLTAYNYTLGLPVIESEGFFSERIARHLVIPIKHYLADNEKNKGSLSQATWFPEPAEATVAAPEGGMIADTLNASRITLCGFGGDPLFEYQPALWLQHIKSLQLGRLVTNSYNFVKTHGRLPPLHLTSFIKKHMRTEQTRLIAVPAWFKPGFFTEDYLARKKALMASPQRLSSGMFTHPFWSFLFEISHPGFSGLQMKFRQPFFSLDLFNFIQSVPPHLLYNKLLMRLAMMPYLPIEVLQRQKTLAYSTSPLQQLKNDGIVELLNKHLQSPPTYLESIIDIPALLEVINDPANLKKADYLKINTLTNILTWNNL